MGPGTPVGVNVAGILGNADADLEGLVGDDELGPTGERLERG